MSKSCFEDLRRKFGTFCADYFVSDHSHRMRPFYARFVSGESQGVDAFSVSWKKGRGFCHPPVGLLSRVVCKAERERAKGVLVAPDWPGSGRLAVVEDRVRIGSLILAETVSLRLECPREIILDTFRGVPKFLFNVYLFNF